MKCKWYYVCPLRNLEEQGRINNRWKKEYCEKDFEKCKRYKMEEKGIYHKDNLLPDGSYVK